MVRHIANYPGLLINTIDDNCSELPKPLKWIEPSINNLYLEASASFLFGNYLSSIVTASILLEHTLRLAVVDKNNCGFARRVPIKQIDKYKSLTEVINEALTNTTTLNNCNEQWWKDVAKYIRNKTAHYLLPMIMTDCIEQNTLQHYFRTEIIESKMNDPDHFNTLLVDWGSFYHKDNRYFASHFLKDVFDQLTLVINNTNWQGDESYWKSQKDTYDLFFSFNWSFDDTISAMQSSRFSL